MVQNDGWLGLYGWTPPGKYGRYDRQRRLRLDRGLGTLTVKGANMQVIVE